MKVCSSTFHFIQYIHKNPGCTSRDIHDYLMTQHGYTGNLQLKRKPIARYDEMGRFKGYEYKMTGGFDSGRYSYLTSPYFSNMLTVGRRTKSRPWVHRIQCPKLGVWTYFLTARGCGAVANIEMKEEPWRIYPNKKEELND